jgi:hypothetical protein
VDDANRTIYRDMVTYVIQERSTGSGRSGESWWPTRWVTPPLVLRGRDGDTLTLHGDYRLLGVTREYEIDPRKRYEGFAAGDPVGVYGTVASSPAGVRVLGVDMTHGDATTLIADQEEGMLTMVWTARCAILGGLLCVAAHVWRRRRQETQAVADGHRAPG